MTAIFLLICERAIIMLYATTKNTNNSSKYEGATV